MISLEPLAKPQYRKYLELSIPEYANDQLRTAFGPQRRPFKIHGKPIKSCSRMVIPQTIISGPFTTTPAGWWVLFGTTS